MPLRRDLLVRNLEGDSNAAFILIDPKGYAIQPVTLPRFILPFLLMLDGKRTAQELENTIKTQIGDDTFVIDSFVEAALVLDKLGYAQSPMFEAIKEDIDNYETLKVRPAACSGSSYSYDAAAAADEIALILNSVQTEGKESCSKPYEGKAKAIIAPHLDFRNGVDVHKSYSLAYSAIANTDADLFVILGTAHEFSSGYFMFSNKDFATSLGVVESDKSLLDEIRATLASEMIFDEKAHRFEHSVEYQVILLQAAFPQKNFKILPILTGTIFEHIIDKTLPIQNPAYSQQIEAMQKAIAKLGRKAVYIASGDFAHIGRKFGDEFDAASMLPSLEISDKQLLDVLARCKADDFFNSIAENEDSNRICGMSPFYALFHLASPSEGKALYYYQWYEKDTLSAVSCASLAFK